MKQLPGNVKGILPFLLWLQIMAPLYAEESSQWSDWSGWSKCPSECGQGISVRNRLCRNSENGDLTATTNCPGTDVQRRLCLDIKCPKSGPSPRQRACSKYDNRIFSGKQYVWEPFMHLSDPCKLSCRAKDAHFYANLAERVQDGVECGQDGVLAVCITGECQPVGCDNIVLSTAKKDKCGRCGGDGTTCKTISGIFTSTQLTRGLNHVLTIPSGSTGINITELMPSKNMLALQTITGDVFINADEDNPTAGSINAAGTFFKYSPKTSISPRESILADGPTNITLVLKVLSKGSNPGIIYTFSVPHNVTDSYMQQITSHSVKALSVQAAPVYLEDDEKPKSIPYANDINENGELPSPVEEGGYSGIHKEGNFDDTGPLGTPEMKAESDEQILVPSDGSLHPSGFASSENISLNASKPREENFHNISVSQSENTTSSHSVPDSNSASEENKSENIQDNELDDQNLEQVIDSKEEDYEGTNEPGRRISTDTSQKDSDSADNVIDRKRDMLDFDNINITKEVTTSPLSNFRHNNSGPKLPDGEYLSPETNISKEKLSLSPISEGSDIIDDMRTFQTSTSRPPGGFSHSGMASKRYKIPKYSQSFTFAEKYKNRSIKRNRRRNSRRRGRTSQENVNRDNGGYSSRRRPVIRQPPSILGNDNDVDTFNDQRFSSGQQLSYSHRSEPRGDETSALESRPVTVRRYRYYGQQHSNEKINSQPRSNDRMKSLRERQARIQERHRRLREQREEYNRRLRERHERQLRRRWQRAHGRNSSQSPGQQRYTKVTVRSRPDSLNNYRGGLSALETTTVVNVPSSSRFSGYSGQRRASLSRSSLGSRDRDIPVTQERRFPVRIQPKPMRIIPNEGRSGREELVSRESDSFPLSEKPVEKDPSPSEHYVETTSSQQILATTGVRLEHTTSSFSSEETEIKDLLGDNIQYKKPTSPTGGKEASSTTLNRRRVIARVRSNQTKPPILRRRIQPLQPSSRESEIPPQVIPATRTNRDNVIIPNTHLSADQYQPDLIPNRQIPANKIIGYTSYEWRISGLTECTHSCGGGVQQTVVVCVAERTQAVVTDENCADVQKPELKAVTCNKRPCPAQWISGPWSSCSVTCDEGIQTRSLYCQTRVSPTLNLTMPATSCEHLDKPEETQTCKTKSCNSWSVGNWSECSANCGDGVRTRTVQCMDINQQTVAGDQCTDLKPKEEQECDQGSCGKGWFVTHWPKECPVQCGKGELVRKVFCAADDGEALPESRCDANQRPRTHRPCRVDTPCGGFWFSGEWSKCNSTCGKGWRNREILCVKKVPGNLFAVVEEENCQSEYKPKEEKPCILPDCEPEWYMTSWGQCSKRCETGYRTREIKCLSPQQAPSDQCSIDKRPRTREPCNTESCEKDSSEDDLSSDSDDSCTDKYAQCRIVKRARLCRYGYYKKMCCKACSGKT